MRRSTIFECSDHTAELFIDDALRITRNLECFVHDLWLVISNCTRRQFDTIAHNVILKRENIERILRLQCIHFPLGHREWIVTKDHFLLQLIPLEHREVNDPTELEGVLLDQIELLSNACPREPSEFGCNVRFRTRKEYAVIWPQLHLRDELCYSLWTQVLCDTATPFTTFEVDVTKSGVPLVFGPLIGTIEEAACSNASAWCWNRPHYGAFFDRLRKHTETTAAEDFGDIRNDNRIPKVRLIATVLQHRFFERDSWKRRRRHLFATTELFEYAVQYGFDGIEDIFLRHKTHLKVKLIELARRSVCPCVFVSKAWSNLKVTIKARDH